MEIERFIRARLNEEETDARAATRAVWAIYPGDPGFANLSVATDREGDGCMVIEDARHAARQDPAATLARVAALRALVAEHVEWEGSGDCSSCGDVPQVRVPCPTLCHVVAIWCWHPDYCAEWAPAVSTK